jgi:hypothetical protein
MSTSLRARRPLVSILLVLVLASCASSLDSLAPFPCAEDGTCPTGFVCDSASKTCAACPSPSLVCSSACIDPANDPSNCGGCGIACASGMCGAGQCICSTAPGGGACTVSPQCGCGSGEKCARQNGAPESCVGVGTGGPGASCASDSDCDENDVCFVNLCTPTCTGKESCTGAHAECLSIYYGGVSQGYSGCATHCDPLAPRRADASHSACTVGQSCVGASYTKGATYCIGSTDALSAGSNCASDGECAPGATCVINTCRAYCAVGATCPTPESCVALDNIYDDNIELGTCQAPPCDLLDPQSSNGSFTPCPQGDTCSATSVPSACVPLTAKGTEGAACAGPSDCEPGLGCALLSSSAASGTCAVWCTVGQPCTGTVGDPTLYECVGFTPAFKQDDVALGYCYANCSVVDPESPGVGEVACPASGDTCTVYSGSPAYAGCVAVTQDGATGAPCQNASECSPGDSCVFFNGSTTSGTCYPWCVVGESACASGTCVAFSPVTEIGAMTLGSCH